MNELASSLSAYRLPIEDVLMQFESLGKNCELGIVQRCAGIEPLGLFRFAFTPLAPLLRCVAESFAGLAREDNVRLETAADGEYMVRLSDYGFVYHTARKTGEIDPEQLREDEVRRLGFMIRKLRAELQSPAKIFVRYGEGPEDFDAIKTLQAELRRFGPVKLLWVTEATPAQRPGTVTMLEPDLMHGAIDKFAHSDDAQSTSFTCWADLCRNALALTQLQAGPGTALSAPWRGNAAANLLAGRLTAAGQSDITEITVSGLAPNRMYTASLWIKAGPIPPDTARLIADGLNSRRTRRANPPLWGQWQRLEVSFRTPVEFEALRLRLLLTGPPDAAVSTTFWRLEPGLFVDDDAVPEAVSFAAGFVMPGPVQWQSAGAANALAALPPPVPGLPVYAHRLHAETTVETAIVVRKRQDLVDAHETYETAVWIWIPTAFQGEQVSLVIEGFPSISATIAVLSQRDTWQQIKSAATIPAGAPVLFASFFVLAQAGAIFFSSGWTCLPLDD